MTVVSPHLDDAVLSCGRLLAGNPGSVVVTVLAGDPGAWAEPTTWDAACGFGPGEDAVAARRAEDVAALAVLDALAVHLDLLDQQYRAGPLDPTAVADAVEEVLPDEGPVVVPLGLTHPDHIAVAEAMALLRARHRRRAWWAAADIPYEGMAPAEADRRSAGLEPGEPGPLGRPERKERAIACYRSQLRGLVAEAAFFGRPERYWRLGTMAG